MADNIVVIGRGKLIASTSMKDLVAGNSHSSIFVRVNDLGKLQSVLKSKSITYQPSEGGLKVSGVQTDEIGRLAFEQKLTVLELASHNASLEDAFLQLTADSEEYQTSKSAKEATS